MGYLEDIQTQINNRDFNKFLQLWEEYCTCDSVETEEFVQLLKTIKSSDFAKPFGRYIEMALPLWKTIADERESYEVLKHLIDLQTTNTPLFADLSLEAIKKHYGQQNETSERLRLIGLRNRESFQGALSNYDLLAHLGKGKFVFHYGGWGTGEIFEVSAVREQMAVEFENVAGRKHITFANAFKTLIPLPNDHFLARRFSDPDLLEKEARENPIAIVKKLLQDLGPKTAAEIKDELCELVIPDADWAKWWQGVRSRLKKDTMVDTPEGLKEPFRLRKSEVSHEALIKHSIHENKNADEIIQNSYNFIRDQPAALKKQDIKEPLKAKLLSLLDDPSLNISNELQILILLSEHFGVSVPNRSIGKSLESLKDKDIEAIIHQIQIVALKKRVLMLVREKRKDWPSIFLNLLTTLPQSTLRDYILKELNQGENKKALVNKLNELLNHPAQYPELFFWYFQKVVGKDKEEIPFADKNGESQFFESFFILFNALESKPEHRELLKKMYNLLTGQRYAMVRRIIEGTSLDFIKEFLLLVSKCQTLSDHDIKILRSLAEVVHPSLAPSKKRKGAHGDNNIIWTTEEGYLKTQERARQIGTQEIVENAREIEAARALGDLRENGEYKSALERRSRLQGELKMLSDQLHRARLITRDDISRSEIGVGNVVDLQELKSHTMNTYSILGPWDANVDAHILSSESKFAQAMHGLKVGDTFQFRDEEYKVLNIKSYLDK